MRGISALIVVVLLLLISIALAIATYSWLTATQAEVFGGIEAQQEAGLRASGSQVTILSVDQTATPTIYLQNTGRYELSNFAVYVNSSPVTPIYVPGKLAPGDRGNVTLSLLAQGFYEIKITTPYAQAMVSIEYKPITVSLTGVPASWQNSDATAGIDCHDTVPCNVTSYRVKSYTTNPGTCPITYSTYTQTVPYAVAARSWLCGVANDTLRRSWFTTSVAEFKVDKLAPTTSVTDPPALSWFNTTFTSDFSYADTGGSNLSVCQYRVLSNSVETLPWTAAGTCSGTSAALSNNITAGPGQNCRDQGSNKCRVEIRDYDVAGSSSTIGSSNFSIDWTPPVVVFNSPANSTTQSNPGFNVNYSATDSISGPLSCVISTKSGTEGWVMRAKDASLCGTNKLYNITVGAEPSVNYCHTASPNYCSVRVSMQDAAHNTAEIIRTFWVVFPF